MDLQQTVRRAIAAKYLVSGRIDTHGESNLFRATQVDTGRTVVIREFTPHGATPTSCLQTLTRVASVSSRFLADLIDVASLDETTLYVAHTLLDGESLTQRLARKEKLHPVEAGAMFVRMLKGLDSLHKRELLHGGVRPTRVFHEKTRRKGWHVKLLSAGVPNLSPEFCKSVPELVRYSPPEFLRGDALTFRSDVWAASAVLYEVIAGKSPFDAPTAVEVAARVSRGEFTKLSEVVKGVKPELDELLARALDADPAARFESAGTLLEAALAIFPESERPPAPEHNTAGGSATGQGKWTKGGVVGKAGAEPLALPPAHQTKTGTVVRKQKRAVRRASMFSVVLTAVCFAAVLGALYVRTQRRERALLLQMQVQQAESRARAAAAEQRAEAQQSIREAEARARAVRDEAERSLAAQRAAVAASVDASAPAPNEPNAHRDRTRDRANTPARDNTVSAGEIADGMGLLAFRSAEPCDLMLDGSQRGSVASARIPLRPGGHALTCRNEAQTHRLVVRISSGRITHVRLTASDEAEVYTEEPRVGP